MDFKDIAERIKNNVNPREEESCECEICNDTGYIREFDDDGVEYLVRCVCFDQKNARRLMKHSGISKEEQSNGIKDFNTYDDSRLIQIRNIAADYYMNFDVDNYDKVKANSLLLSGASGRGKTRLGIAVANNLINKKGMFVRYTSYRDISTKLKQRIFKENEYDELMKDLKTCSVLFIDDLLKGNITKSDADFIYEIINYRYNAKLPIIISTEMYPRDLIEYDEAIGGRILEMCEGHIAIFDKDIPNHRLRGLM